MFLIRADGNAKIGAGHLMRCLTIADALRRQTNEGRDILFVCADRQSAQLAESRGYESFVLESDPRNMEAELSAWHNVPDINKKTNVILIDSYFVTKRYLQEIKKYGHVTLLDDLGEQCFPADRIVNYNVFADRKHYEALYATAETELILGGDYVPIRPQFREKPYRIREQAEHILITTGGGDIDNIAGQILRKLEEKAAEKIAGRILNYHLIIGSFNPHFEELKALEKKFSNIHIYRNVQNMAELMRRCDLAVTAGGSTVYELAAVGIPFICFSYAENQERMAEYIGKEGIACFAGAFHKEPETTLERIADQAVALIQDYCKRNICYLKEIRLIDGTGAERLAKLLAETKRKSKTKT